MAPEPELIAVVVADPALLDLDAAAPSPATRFLGISLAWRAVLQADRLGAREVFLIGDRGLVSGIATSHRLTTAVSSGTLADLMRLLSERPAATVLFTSPWIVASGRHLAPLTAHAQEGPAIAIARTIDPVRPWPEATLRENTVARIGRHLEGASAQVLPLWGGPTQAMAAMIEGDGSLLDRVPAGARAVFLPDVAFEALLSPAHLPRAARWLFRGVRSSADGLVDRYLNRTLSRWFTLAVVNRNVTPNEITAVALLMGLASVALVMTGSYGFVVAGAVLLQLSAVVDCSDGEVARLKYLESRWGAYLDLIADNVVHIALFLAIGRAVSVTQGPLALRLGALAAAGGLIAFLLVFSTLLGKGPVADTSPVQRFIDKMTNRDFSVLLLACAIADRLEWFLWALALGVQAFWIVLATLKAQALYRRRLARAAGVT